MSVKEAIVIVLDIGVSATKHKVDDSLSFLDMSKKCIERIIKRKIFSSAGDEVALVLLGTEDSVNTLGYSNISEGFRLSNPSWQMLKVLEEIKGTDVEQCDWIDALVVAMDLLQIQLQGKKFTGKKIVLLVNLDNYVKDDKLDIIINGLKALEIELTALGVDLFPEPMEEGKKQENDLYAKNHNGETKNVAIDFSGKPQKERGEALLAHIITEIGGLSCNFNDALAQLKTYQQKFVRPTPWNVNLDIGPNIHIPVAAYKKIAEPTSCSWKKTVLNSSAGNSTWKKPSDDATSQEADRQPKEIPLDEERVYMKDDQSNVEKSDIISGYYFGTSAVPFNEYDERQMSYKPSGKCLSVLRFASQDEVPRRLFIGEGNYFIVAQKQMPEAQQALSALIQTLYEQKKVAIVTRNYNVRSFPRIAALFPLIKKKFECLLLVGLPFSEEVNEFTFPRVVPVKDEPNKQELDAMDSLMDAMDLMEVEKDGEIFEAFSPKETFNPATMNEFQSIEHRVLHPNDPLPPLSEDIKEMLNNPFQMATNYTSSLSKLKDVFRITEQPEMSSLKKKHHSKKNKKQADVNDANEPQPSTSSAGVVNVSSIDSKEISIVEQTLVEVGSSTPHSDFNALLARGEPMKTICEQMQKVILNLVLKSFGFESFPKAVVALKTLRDSCVKKDPSIYNNWLPDFKVNLDERDRMKFWEYVVKDGLGLISTEENNLSTITPENATKFLEEKKEEINEGEEEEVDADDLFDEM